MAIRQRLSMALGSNRFGRIPMAPTEEFTPFHKRHWSTLQGALAGLGVGLLCCDLIDLFGRDLTALTGWWIAVITGPIVGGLVGNRRASRPPVPRAASPDQPDWKLIGWLLLGEMIVVHAGLSWKYADRSLPPVRTYLMIMTVAGTLYLGIPLGIAAARWWRRHRPAPL